MKKKKKEENIIMYNLPESEKGNGKEREEMCEEIFQGSLGVKNV